MLNKQISIEEITLEADTEIVLAAVKNNGIALEYASKELN